MSGFNQPGRGISPWVLQAKRRRVLKTYPFVQGLCWGFTRKFVDYRCSALPILPG